MTIETIPTSTDPFYEQRTSLDGVDYLLSFAWNQREEKWYLSIADETGDPIVEGIKLVTDWNLLAPVVDSRRPAGQLRVVDLQAEELTSNPRRDPTLTGLGTRWVLLYFDAAEVAALFG